MTPSDPRSMPRTSVASGTSFVPVHHAETPTLTPRQVPVVGRRSQVETLAAVIGESGSGPCPLILVSGEAGIGKSTLVEQVHHMVPGPVFLVGRCLDFGDPPSYAPFVAILRNLSRDERFTHARQALAPAVEAALTWLLPEFASAPEAPPGPRVHVFDAVLTLLEQLAETAPVVLVVEDLHWADQSTWDLLLFIVGNASETRLTILVTYRDLPLGHPLRGPLAQVSRLPQASHCPLEGLRRADVAVQFAALAGSPPTREETDEVMRLSSGNPLFVEAAVDLIHHHSDLGHNQQLLLAPIERLPADTQAVIRTVAVAGSSILHRTLLLVSGLDEPALEEALRPAVDSRVLVATDDGYRFRHDLIARLVHDELLLPSERSRLHRVLAQAITSDPTLAPPVLFHSTREIARHWKESGDVHRALPATWQAAQEGRNSLAHPERLRLLQDVLALWPSVSEAADVLGVSRAHVLHDAVEAAEESGRSELGLDLAGEALTEALDAREGDTAAAILERRSRLRAQMGVQGASDDLRLALEQLPAGPSRLRGQLLAQLADRLRWAGDRSAAEPLAVESLRVAEAADDDYGRVRAKLAKLGLLARSDLAAARGGIAEACTEAESLGLPVLAALAAFAAAEVEILAGDRQAAVAAARRGLRATMDAGQEATLGARLAAQLAESLAALGYWDEAEEALEHALELEPPPGYRARLLAQQGLMLHARGDTEGARSIREALSDLRGQRPRWADVDTDVAVAELAATLDLQAGQDTAALAVALECATGWTPDDVPHSAWPLLLTAATALRHAPVNEADRGEGVGKSPRDRLAAWVERAPAYGPESLAWRSTIRAELAGVGPGLAAARETELAAWQEADRPEQLGWALVRSSYVLLASSKKIEAADRLRDAREIGEDLGALHLVRAADELASRAGLDLSRSKEKQPGQKSAHGLTPREGEVLGLISLGRTNRQIGEELFISAKTASIHVSRILTKLGVANRGEAAAEAHRLGIVAPELAVE
jgi:DNA-binding CsgD family transcriptional regulator/tetratricopeptide (TPR) repeat protein